MSDNELINWVNKHFGNDKYEFKYIYSTLNFFINGSLRIDES